MKGKRRPGLDFVGELAFAPPTFIFGIALSALPLSP